MKGFVYLVFSHGDTHQLIRLAKAIRRLSPQSAIVFHHDASSGPLSSEEFDGIGNVHVIPTPIAVKWGDISFVDAFILSSRWILDNLDTEWLITLSGMDYPIQPLAEFELSLSKSGFDAAFRFFEAFTHPGWPKGEGEKRYRYSYYQLPEFTYYYRVPQRIKESLASLVSIINKSQSWIKIRPGYRNLKTAVGIQNGLAPFNDRMVCYGGWDWFNLNKKSLNEIHRFLNHNQSFRNYYKRTTLPSESMVHTILLNNPDFKIDNDAHRHIKWIGSASASPSIITAEDFESIIQSKHPFARKFNINVDETIFDKLDNWTQRDTVD